MWVQDETLRRVDIATHSLGCVVRQQALLVCAYTGRDTAFLFGMPQAMTQLSADTPTVVKACVASLVVILYVA